MTALPLAELMNSLSAELARLAGRTEAFHDLLVEGSGGLDPLFMRKAQSIDYTTQMLAELADFCANLSPDMPTGAQVDAGLALSLVRLSELRDRLVPQAPAGGAWAAADGVCEMF